jgi:hypothetical protein
MYMASVDRDSMNTASYPVYVPGFSPYTNRVVDGLTEEIDKLRLAMTETFLREHSLTSCAVVELSRQLDVKILEYMKQAILSR